MANLLEKTGKITFLRAHDLGTAYGPPNDQLDVEAVFMLNNMTSGAYGFQLRNDDNLPARQAMFSLLRDALVNNLPVTADYMIDTGKQNGIAIRIALTPAPGRILHPVVSGPAIQGQALAAPIPRAKAHARAGKAGKKRRSPKTR
jgi:hypothetical protein